MCITEIWTYPECGCCHQRRLLCINATTEGYQPRLSQLSSFRSVDSSTLACLGYTTSPADSSLSRALGRLSISEPRSTCQSHRPVSHTEHRQFLTPICDECLLEEMSCDKISRMDLAAKVECSVNDEVSKEVLVRDVTSHEAAANNVVKVYDGDEDADDEGSHGRATSSNPSNSSSQLSTYRGRFRERTKQLRRRAVDLSHEHLRISSRWNSDEKRQMMDFRDAIEEAAKDGSEAAFSRFVKKQNVSPQARLRKVRSWVTDLRKRMRTPSSRTTPRRSKSILCFEASQCDEQEDSNHDTTHPTAGQQASSDGQLSEEECLSHAEANVEGAKQQLFLSALPFEDEDFIGRGEDRVEHRCLCNTCVAGMETPTFSWEEHLRHDLVQQKESTRAVTPKSIPAVSKSDICFTTPDPSRRSSRSSTNFPVVADTPQQFEDWMRYDDLLRLTERAPELSSASSDSDRIDSQPVSDIIPSCEFEISEEDQELWRQHILPLRQASHFRSLSGTTMFEEDDDGPHWPFRPGTPPTHRLFDQVERGLLRVSVASNVSDTTRRGSDRWRCLQGFDSEHDRPASV